jgi:hypothetical protein
LLIVSLAAVGFASLASVCCQRGVESKGLPPLLAALRAGSPRCVDHCATSAAITDLEELKENVRDAVACHFDPEQKPTIIRLHFVTEEVIAA